MLRYPSSHSLWPSYVSGNTSPPLGIGSCCLCFSLHLSVSLLQCKCDTIITWTRPDYPRITSSLLSQWATCCFAFWPLFACHSFCNFRFCNKMTALHGTDSKATKSSTQPEFLERIIPAASGIRPKFSVHASGPGAIFNPTNVRLRMKSTGSDGLPDPAPDMAFLWRSRDQRKGRTSIAVPRDAIQESSRTPRFTASFRQVRKGILRMVTVFPYLDMAYLVGLSFTIGSAIFVANGLICLLPLVYPTLKFEGEPKNVSSGLTSFTGALAFQIGASLAYLEAVNGGSFHGSFMRRFLLGGKQDEEKQLMKLKLQDFFHHVIHPRGRGDNVLAPVTGWPTAPTIAPVPRRGALDLGAGGENTRDYSRFRWWPTWESLSKHYIYEVGWAACTVQLIASTLYMVVGTVDLPGILNTLEPWQENFAYWVPNIVASAGFTVASALFALETQDKWYKPQPRILGWWIGFFAFLGSIGFELCASFGPASYKSQNAELQSLISTTWDSACFLVASVLQWYAIPVDQNCPLTHRIHLLTLNLSTGMRP